MKETASVSSKVMSYEKKIGNSVNVMLFLERVLTQVKKHNSIFKAMKS